MPVTSSYAIRRRFTASVRMSGAGMKGRRRWRSLTGTGLVKKRGPGVRMSPWRSAAAVSLDDMRSGNVTHRLEPPPGQGAAMSGNELASSLSRWSRPARSFALSGCGGLAAVGQELGDDQLLEARSAEVLIHAGLDEGHHQVERDAGPPDPKTAPVGL